MLNLYQVEDLEISVKGSCMHLKGQIHFKNVSQILALGEQIMDSRTIDTISLQHLHDSNSSGLALLCAWLRRAHQENKALFFKEVPSFIRDIARVYGLDKVLKSTWEN